MFFCLFVLIFSFTHDRFEDLRKCWRYHRMSEKRCRRKSEVVTQWSTGRTEARAPSVYNTVYAYMWYSSSEWGCWINAAWRVVFKKHESWTVCEIMSSEQVLFERHSCLVKVKNLKEQGCHFWSGFQHAGILLSMTSFGISLSNGTAQFLCFPSCTS